MNTRRRPKSAAVPRDEQLRRAKRAQRARERAAKLAHVQLTLPNEIARKLAVARASPRFVAKLDGFLDRLLVRIADYPQLRDIAWNCHDELIPACEAFALYERNWRYVDAARLDDRERALIERLKAEFGAGILHA